MPDSADLATLERRLRRAQERARRLKAELRLARLEARLEREGRDQALRILTHYIEHNDLRRVYTLHVNVRAAAAVLGLSLEDVARMSQPLSIGEIHALVERAAPARAALAEETDG